MKLRNSKNKKLIKLASRFMPFDYAYALYLEKQALTQMADYLDNSDIAYGNKENAADIRLALKLLAIATDDVYQFQNYNSDGSMTVYVNTKNWNRFLPKAIGYNWDKPILQNALRCEKAWYLYNKIRLERMKAWWD